MLPLVLYDGLCGFCDASVQLLLRLDRKGVLRFAPLQGETAKRWTVPDGVDSIVFVDERGPVWESEAALRILAVLGWPWRALTALRVVPRPLRDLAYRGIARVRYRIFGRREACRVPSPGQRARFLP